MAGDAAPPAELWDEPRTAFKMDGCVMERAPHTCEVLQRRALDPEAEHLLHRQIHRIIPVRRHGPAAAARVRTPL